MVLGYGDKSSLALFVGVTGETVALAGVGSGAGLTAGVALGSVCTPSGAGGDSISFGAETSPVEPCATTSVS